MCPFVLSLGNWRAHGQHFLCMTVCKISDHREGQWRLFLRVSMKASWRQHGDGGGAVRPQFDSKAWVEMWKSQCIPHTDTLMLAISRHLAGKQVRKHPPSKAVVFSSSHIWMWELDHKEGWAPKNWCFQIVKLEDSWESRGLQGD